MSLLATSLTGLIATFSTLGVLFSYPASHAAEPDRANGEYIVKFRWNAGDNQLRHAVSEGRLRIKRHVQTRAMFSAGDDGLTLVTTELPPAELARRLRNDPTIESIEPNFIYRTTATSNDPQFLNGSLWGMFGPASSPVNVYGSAAAEAWASGYTGSTSVMVAVIDDGLQTTHADLVNNVWVNPFDPVDGLDNDGNGYIDDLNGWNFAADSSSVYVATDKHGTHVAGTIGAKGGNSLGVAGVNWKVGLIAAKFLAGGSGTAIDAVEAIDYIVDLKSRHNLNIVAINASWGGPDYSESLHSAVLRAAKAGILCIAAAGNSSLNNDFTPFYPANFDTRVASATESAASYDAVIAVAAITASGGRAGFSNYGLNTVDIAAPGVSIISTIPNGYGYMSGTSMAAPHVTGGVALYASTHPLATPAEIRAALLDAATPTPSMSGKTVTGGRLNLSTVINAPPPLGLEPPAEVTVTAQKSTIAGEATINVKWSAVNTATTYTVRRALHALGPWTIVGSSLTDTNLTEVQAAGVAYYYTVASADASTESAPSPSVSVTPAPPTPSNLVAIPALNGTSAKITWADNCSDEQGFKLEMDIGAGWRPPTTIKANAASVNIPWMSGVSVYKFRLRAYNGTAYSEYSNEATVVKP